MKHDTERESMTKQTDVWRIKAKIANHLWHCTQLTAASSLRRYKRCDELIWVKTNQLQRLIRTGRTGHWINHGKEHCLVSLIWCLLSPVPCSA